MKEKSWFSLEAGDKLVVHSLKGKQTVRFRQDPLPCKRYVWKNRPRHYHTIRELRVCSDGEMAAHARAGRMEELGRLFEVCRVSEKSWKSHRKHQWK